MRRAADVLLTLIVGIAVGIVIGFLLGFTHGPPTPENSSPPPEAFDYPIGILVGVVGAVVVRLLVPLVRRRRGAVDE